MADPPRHPVMLDLAGRRCVVVGGGAVAWRKVQALREAGARVTVIAPRLDDRLAAEVADGGITWDERSVDAADLRTIEQLVTGDGNGAGDRGHGDRGHGHGDDPDGVGDGGSTRPWLVVAATDDPGLNRAIADAGTRHGTWVTDATDPGGGPASSAAIHRAGPVTVAVSTAGVSPSAAAWLRDELAAAVDPAVVTALELLAEVQAEAWAGAGTVVPTESAGHGREPDGGGGGRAVSGHVGGRIGRSDWRSLLDSGMLDDIREGHRAKAKERLQACLSSSSD